MTREELIQELRGKTVEIGDVFYSTVALEYINITVKLIIVDPELLLSQMIQTRIITEKELNTLAPDDIISILHYRYDYEINSSEYGLEYQSWRQDD